LNTKTHTFAFCNAGHNPPYLINAKGSIQELKTGGIVLGMMQDATYETETIELHKEDSIVMYTDGITEAMNAQEDEFGELRLQEIIKENNKESAEHIIEVISSDVKNYTGNTLQSDDITMVVVKFKK
ncbi:MAG: PP2C family protein-serine/threonine phosphatase, partial [bacterium]